jgi:hypothetical protein
MTRYRLRQGAEVRDETRQVMPNGYNRSMVFSVFRQAAQFGLIQNRRENPPGSAVHGVSRVYQQQHPELPESLRGVVDE